LEGFAELHHFSTKLEISKLLAHFAEAKVELLKDKPHLENNGHQIDLHSQIDLKKEAFLSRKRT